MQERPVFVEAMDAMRDAASSRSSLCAPFLSAFPVTGASVSVLAGPASQSTMCSTDATAARIDEIQFDLGEGPCWTAMHEKRAVLGTGIRSANRTWPTFSEAVRNDSQTRHVDSLFAFPLAVGGLDIGAVDMYTEDGEQLEASLVAEATTLAGLAAWQVLRRILDDHGRDYDSESLGFSRREVHQATGMIIVQLDISAADAELLLRAHAFSSGRSVSAIAKDVVERRLTFSPQPPPMGLE